MSSCPRCGAELELVLAEPPQPAWTDADVIVRTMLGNYATHGYNPVTDMLHINWRPSPLGGGANFDSQGNQDPERKDALCDLRYLRALATFARLYPAERELVAEPLQRWNAWCLGHYGNSTQRVGWIYDELSVIAAVTQDPAWSGACRNFAGNWLARIDKPSGLRLESNGTSYRVDHNLEGACALLVQGELDGHTGMLDAGWRALDYLIAHAYCERFESFAANVSLDGTFYRDPSNNGALVKSGQVPQQTLSLIRAYGATRDARLLELVFANLEAQLPRRNSVGLWDASSHGGYFAQSELTGGDTVHTVTGYRPQVTKKNAGRSAQFLEAYALAARLELGDYADHAATLLELVCDPARAWVPQSSGYVFEQNADWSLMAQSRPGTGVKDWCTAEAMGIAFEGLYHGTRERIGPV